MDPITNGIIIGIINLLLLKLANVIEEKCKLQDGLKTNLEDIKFEMEAIKAAIREHTKTNSHEITELWIREVRELAYDIEDCIDLFIGRVDKREANQWYMARKFNRLMALPARTQFEKEIKELLDRARRAYERRKRYINGTVPTPTPESTDPYTPEDELVGIQNSKKELLELLALDEAKEQPWVISIVGCRGLGKTTLARAVYESSDVKNEEIFPCRAWVVASECKDASELLSKILQQVRPGETSQQTTSTVAQLTEDLRTHLQSSKRYFIVIDDMKTRDQWNNIKPAFTGSTHGRIIVTTSIDTIARNCSSDGGHVYRMQALSKNDSWKLLSKAVFGSNECTRHFEGGSESILGKCDGLPLALVSFADFLRPDRDSLTKTMIENECRRLGFHLEDQNNLFGRLKRALVESYSSLPGHDLKTCLLSVSMFPEGYKIKRKRLVRQWLAEGLIGGTFFSEGSREETMAHDYFKNLIDQNVIQPVDIGDNSEVKTCQVHGVMLDFIAHKSIKENFIVLMSTGRPSLNGKIARRLSIQNINARSNTGATGEMLSRVRSLSVFQPNARDLNVDLEKCELLRVLDLENCQGLTDRVLDRVCKLVRLKYLSLRHTRISNLPGEVSKLQSLETLDIRGTEVGILPMDILLLPKLAHLFGRFLLPRELNNEKFFRDHENFFREESNLQTLAGFKMDGESQGFEHIMLHMGKLVKVKIWSVIGTASPPSELLTERLIKSLRRRFVRNKALDSLSIEFGDQSIDFLGTLNVPCVRSSIKLQGRLSSLPNFITSQHNLTELCLSSVGLPSEVLSALQDLRLLCYLKLVENGAGFGGGTFDVRPNGFQSLQRLCFRAQNLPRVSIDEGAMRCLTTLQLLCEDIGGLPARTIRRLEYLREVTLLRPVADETKEAWENEVKRHTNRPTINYYNQQPH